MGRWPLHKAWFWEYAPFFRVLLPFAAGIMWYNAGGHVPSWAAIVAVFVLVAAYALVALNVRYDSFRKVAAFALLQAFCVFGGYELSALNDITTGTNWFGQTLEKEATYVACITEAPAEKEQSFKLEVEVIRSIQQGGIKALAGRAFVYVYKGKMPMLLQKGDTILLPSKWDAISNAGNPYEVDYAGYCRRNNIYYQQFCSANEVRLYATVITSAQPLTALVHDWCMAQLETQIRDARTLGLIQAMLLGDEVNLDEELRQSFSDTGIVHVIAISGGNIMLFFTFITVLLWWVRHRKYLWVKYAIALPLVWFYVVMAGSSPSAVRAGFMFSILAWGIMFQKNNNSLNQLFATAFLLLCAEPMWLYSLGFQLSFVAVLSLILFYAPVHGLWRPGNKILKVIWETICASFAAEVLVAPLVIYYFHNFPVLFLVANVAAFFFMGLVLIAGIAIIIFSWLPIVAGWLGVATTYLVAGFELIIKWMQRVGPLSFHYLRLTPLQLLLVFVVIGGIAYFLSRKRKGALFAGLGALCILLVLLSVSKRKNLLQQHFVVYNTAKENRIELLKDGHYHIIGSLKKGSSKSKFAVDPLHIEWQAWRPGDTLRQSVFHFQGKTILILDSAQHSPEPFTADFLVVNYTGAIDPMALQKVYRPQLIIIGNNYNRKQQQAWADSAAKYQIPIHTVARDGAFVLGDR